MKRITERFFWLLVGAVIGFPYIVIGQDWFEASGVPAQRSQLSSADLRAEFAAIENDIAAKLPALTGNGNKIVAVNSGGTALTVLSSGISVAQGGTGATTLTGLLQGNGTSAVTGIANSSTVGQTLRVTAASTYAWGALDLADGDAITGDIPDANLSANVPLLNAGNSFSASNTFTDTFNAIDSPAVLLSSASPALQLSETDAAANNGKWAIVASGESLVAAAYTDAGAGGTWLDVSRTSNTIDAIALTATALTHNSIDITPSSGTFTATFDQACTTSPTITFDYQRIGNLVTLAAVSGSGWPCTGDAVTFATTGTPVPAALRPVVAVRSAVFSNFADNGSAVQGCFTIETDGNITVQQVSGGNCSSTWTAASTRYWDTSAFALGVRTQSYMLGNP